jgi:hypothetical protein
MAWIAASSGVTTRRTTGPASTQTTKAVLIPLVPHLANDLLRRWGQWLIAALLADQCMYFVKLCAPIVRIKSLQAAILCESDDDRLGLSSTLDDDGFFCFDNVPYYFTKMDTASVALIRFSTFISYLD